MDKIRVVKLNQIILAQTSPRGENTMRKSNNYTKQKLTVTETFISIKFHHLLDSKYFKLFILLLVLVNIVVMIMDYSEDESSYQSYVCEIFQLILTLIFASEIVIKITVYGLKGFFHNVYDRIDFFIILLNVFEIIYELSIDDNLFAPQSLSSAGIKTMKILRLFRFITELDYWKTGSMLFTETMTTLSKTLDFILVILIFDLMASLYGMQIFAYKVRLEEEKISHDLKNGETPRLNYDTFLESVMTTTLIFLNEEWHVIMFQYMRAYGSVAALYFILVLIIGSVLLIKMFLALFINYFLNSKSIQKLIFKAPIWDKFALNLKKSLMKVTHFHHVISICLFLKLFSLFKRNSRVGFRIKISKA